MRTRFFDAGRLRHEVRLEAVTREADDLGGFAETWAEVATLWAHLEPVSAALAARADGFDHEVTHRAILRADDRLQPGMRLVKDSRVFEIRTVRDLDETGRYALCLTRERSAP